MPRLLVLAIAAIAWFPAHLAAQTQPTAVERVARLKALIGTWETVDTYQPDSPTPIVERGVRTCRLAMKDRYIECVTMGTNAAKREREYRFYITWDGDRNAYTLLSIWSNTGGLSLQTVTPSEDARTWDIRSTTPYVEAGVESRSWSTLTFESADSILWVGRINRSTESPDRWPVSFKETWRRRPGAY